MKLLFENWRGYLNEIGEGSLKPYSYRLSPRSSDENVLYTFKSETEVGAGSHYNVLFNQYETEGTDYWDISFETEFEGLGETGEGQPLKIVSTVVNIVKDFVSRPDLNKNIRTYAFEGVHRSKVSDPEAEIAQALEPSKPPTKTARTKLYLRYLKKHMPKDTKLVPRGNAIWFTVPSPQRPSPKPVDPEYLDQLGGLF